MNCETSPSRRRWPPLGCGDPAPALSKVLGDLLGINNGLLARVPPSLLLTLMSGRAQSWAKSRSAHGQGWEAEGLAAPVLQRGSHLSSETQGRQRSGGRGRKISHFLAARRPSAVQHLNDITALLISCFEPLIEVRTESSGLKKHPQQCCAPSLSCDPLH